MSNNVHKSATVSLFISSATHAMLLSYCQRNGIASPDALAERVLVDALADLEHEDLTTYEPKVGGP